jgi:hypothetical protein
MFKTISINLILIALIVLVAEPFAKKIIENTKKEYIANEELIFIKKYNASLNHLKDPYNYHNRDKSNDGSLHNYIFTSYGSSNKTVLIQGDSWAEGFTHQEDRLQLFKNFANLNKVKFIFAGTGSYAPSILEVQNRVLKEDFDINPDIVIAIIDQSDIGDELCRYKTQLSRDKNGSLIIKPYNDRNYYFNPKIKKFYTFNLSHYFDQYDILIKDENNIKKLFVYSFEKIKEYYANKDDACGSDEIINPLKKGRIKSDEILYFNQRLDSYINQVFNNTKTKKLILVTHFHKGHLDGSYQTNVKNNVETVIRSSIHKKSVMHINFDPTFYKLNEIKDFFKSNQKFSSNEINGLEDIFNDGDWASHLKDPIHTNFFTKEILRNL